MSDLYIPGVKSRFGTDDLVENLMKLERLPKERAEKTVETQKEIKSNWQDVGRRIAGLREAARVLYSFQNPFNDRIGISDNESIVSATATRQADEQQRRFTVSQLASADRFLSEPLAKDANVPAGTYTFSVGEKKISLPWRGGGIQNFIDSLNRRGSGDLKASLLSIQAGSKSLLIESLISGKENGLNFEDAALDLAVDIGMLQKIATASEEIALGDSGEANIPAKTFRSLSFTGQFKGGEDLVLSYEVKANETEYTAQEQGTFTGPPMPQPGSIQYGGITIQNEALRIDIPQRQAPAPPQPFSTDEVLLLRYTDGSSSRLPGVGLSNDFSEIRLPLNSLESGKTIASLEVDNQNTHRNITIKNISIGDPNSRAGFRPKNPISIAEDAILSIDGIALSRPDNTIEDLVPGVSIHLHALSEKPVNISIEPDREGAKDSIINTIGSYNRLMAEINVLLRNDEKLITELSYLDKDEQEAMQEKLGLFQGDSSLGQLRSSLQARVSSSYPTDAERDLALLAQIGISTNASARGGSSGYDASRLRGYLEIDEKKLDAALIKDIHAVAQLFGNDNDGDRIIDSGFAYEIDTLTRAWTETGGILALKTSGIDRNIANQEKRIQNLDAQLANKESELKRKYGMMEGALNTMERTSQSIDQFNTNNSGKK